MRTFFLHGLFTVLVAAAAVAAMPGSASAAPEHGAEAVAGGEDHGEAGVPLDFKADLAFWSLVVFLVFVSVLTKFAWAPLARGLDTRESRIRQDIADAEAVRVKAERMLTDHQQKLDKVQDEVKEILAEARRDAEQARINIVTDAQREAQATLQRSLTEIERARDQAKKEIFEQANDLIVASTEQVLGRSLNGQDQQRLIEEALSEFAGSPPSRR